MSYQVLARKWRPQNFVELAGQDHVLQALMNALTQQRLHHAYLFTGTRGVGKTTIARIFSKCLNCETNGISPEPCGQCASCTEIAEGRFVDLIEVDAASRTKVEDTRELLENVQYSPTRGRFKVYLIDEVHMLSTHSFNALLKTLEEPPEHVKFLLATTDPQKLPVTILSRCLQFNLKNMSSARVVEYLKKVLSTENISYEDAALWQIGQAAQGSMRDALSLTDQAISFGNGQIRETDVTAMLGLVNHAQIVSLLECVVSGNASQVLQRINDLAEYQPDFIALCASLLDLLHRIAIEQQVPGALENQLGDLEKIQQLATSLPAEVVQLFYQNLLIGKRDLPLSHSLKAGFEMLLLRLIAFRPAPHVTLSSDPALAQASTAQPTTEKKTLTNTDIQEGNALVTENKLEVSPLEKNEVAAETTIEPSPDVEEHASRVSTENTPHPVEGQEQPPETENQLVDYQEPIANDVSDGSAFESVAKKENTSPAEGIVESTASEDSTPAPSNKLLAQQNDVDDVEDETDDSEEITSNHSADLMALLRDGDAQLDGIADVDTEQEALTSLDVNMTLSVAKNGMDGEYTVEQGIAQPALALPIERLENYASMTMGAWWLIAPRLPLTGLVHNILMNSCLVEATEQGIRLEVPLEYGHMLNQTRYEQIQEALSNYFEQAVPLVVDTVEDVSAVTAEEFAASKRAEALQAAVNHLNEHPIMQELASSMGAQLIYESVKVKA